MKKLSSLDHSLGSNGSNLEQWSCRWRSSVCLYIKGYIVSSPGIFLLAGILQSLLCSFCCTSRRLPHQTCYRVLPFMPSWMLESYMYSFSGLSGGMMVQSPVSYGDEHAAYIEDFEWPLHHRPIDYFGFGSFLEEPWLHAIHSRCFKINCCKSCKICQDSSSMLSSGRVWMPLESSARSLASVFMHSDCWFAFEHLLLCNASRRSRNPLTWLPCSVSTVSNTS